MSTPSGTFTPTGGVLVPPILLQPLFASTQGYFDASMGVPAPGVDDTVGFRKFESSNLPSGTLTFTEFPYESV